MNRIPIEVDWKKLLEDLKTLGMADAAIEDACHLRKGYVAQLRFGNMKGPSYRNGAALLNLLESLRSS